MPSLTLLQQTDLAPELAEQLHDDVAELFASAQCFTCEASADYRADGFHPVPVFDAEGEERA